MNTVRPTERPVVVPPRGASQVPAVSTACRILEALADRQPTGATLSELGRALTLSKGTMHAQLSTLTAHGLVERNDATRRFRLGQGLVTLGVAAAADPDLTAVAAERLPDLAAEHGLTFALATVTDPTEAWLTHRAYPEQAVHVGLALGKRYGFSDGAIGKCLLASLEPEVAAETLYGATLPRHTEHTITNPDKLLADAKAVRDRGWAVSKGELKENHAVAATLRDAQGHPTLVLCAIGFPSDVPVANFASLGAMLVDVSRAIERASRRSAMTDLQINGSELEVM